MSIHGAIRTRPGWLLNAALCACASLSGSVEGTAAGAEPLVWHARSRVESEPGKGDWQSVERELSWRPAQTAIIVCDMWDRHWCRGATERVAEMAPRMNAVLKAARQRGVLIIHAPSDTMSYYADWPQRKRAQETPKAPAPPQVNQWKSLNRDREPALPIDDSDGGCNEDPQCTQGRAWRSQISTLEIAPDDFISDNGEEVYSVLQARGIEQVIVMGVHTNMCVLGRPFSIRAMVGLGKHVVLMRDMTDTMYNARQRPYVSHFAGTDLVIRHIEQYWCPTVTSADLLGGAPFRFRADVRPLVVILIGEDEYRTWETLPAFAQQELGWRGLETRVIIENPSPEARFPGLADALPQARLLVISTRRRALPKADLEAVRAFLARGGAVVGIRTASHAFAVRTEEPAALESKGLAAWAGFDPEVLGGNYHGHHGAGPETAVSTVPGVEPDGLLTGVDVSRLKGHGSLYRSGPLREGARAVLIGSIPGQPAEPVAWTHRYGPHSARVFYTSFGHIDDFADPQFRRLLLNGILWAMELPIPPAG